MIREIWFLVLAAMLIAYAVLDGFDLGVGVLHLFLGRSEEERKTAISAIGPVWNGNEVWLIAAGGSMVVAFPRLYAAAFSGFYLALMLVLWLLIVRGLAIEFRHQVDDPMWRQGWDVAFSVASILLTVLFGVAVGNVLRGVPLGLFGDFQGSFSVLLNPFAVLAGVLGLSVLALHGASYLAMKTTGTLHERAHRAVGRLWWAAVVSIAAIVAASFPVRPGFGRNFAQAPGLLVVPLIGVICLIALRAFWAAGRDGRVFLMSAGTIVGVLGSAAAGLFPQLLPSPAGSGQAALDIYNAAAPEQSQRIALGIYLVGMAIVVVYLTRIYKIWGGKVRPEDTYHI